MVWYTDLNRLAIEQKNVSQEVFMYAHLYSLTLKRTFTTKYTRIRLNNSEGGSRTNRTNLQNSQRQKLQNQFSISILNANSLIIVEESSSLLWFTKLNCLFFVLVYETETIIYHKTRQLGNLVSFCRKATYGTWGQIRQCYMHFRYYSTYT